MAKSKSPGRTPVGKQINFRAPDDMQAALEYIARIRAQDVSSLIRLIISDHIHEYEEQARQLEEARRKAKGRRGEPG